MAEQLIEVHLSPQKTFLVVCPHCNQSKIFNLNDLPSNAPNPFNYECRCGGFSSVLLNYRRSYRKRVNLAGMFTVPCESKKIERICSILDISATGMQIVTDYFKTISEGQLIHTTVILDEKVPDTFSCCPCEEANHEIGAGGCCTWFICDAGVSWLFGGDVVAWDS